MGATPKTIMRIFMVQGAAIGIVGTLIGMLAGVALASHVTQLVQLIEHTFHVQFLSANVYFVNYLPSELQYSDVLKICSISLALSFVATIYPAWRASKTQPIEALRYE
jgi:lipoprotein-releasing system permease protein